MCDSAPAAAWNAEPGKGVDLRCVDLEVDDTVVGQCEGCGVVVFDACGEDRVQCVSCCECWFRYKLGESDVAEASEECCGAGVVSVHQVKV